MTVIPHSRFWKLTAASTALVAHGALALSLYDGEEVLIEAQQGGQDVKIGTGFADMAVGTLTAETVNPEAPERVEPKFVERAEPSETEAPPAPKRSETSDPVAVQQTQPEIPQALTVAPSANTVVPSPPLESVKPVPTARAAVPLTPVTPTPRAETAQPQQPSDATQTTPEVETLEALEDIKAAPLASKRPQRRTKEFETANAPKVRQPQPKRQQATSRGNARQNATAGASSGNRNATATRQGTVSGTAKAQGNAAASNYPGQVWSRLSRVRRPNGRGEAQVQFTIGANGGIASVSVVRSSGSSRFDRAAAQIVRRAGPFPRPPAGARRTFTFTVKGG